jgi:hypothetical protein
MSGISRTRFDGTFDNSAVDLTDQALGAALKGAGLDPKRLDALDGKADGRVTGQQAIDDLYDEINRLDTRTATLASKQEGAVWSALQGARIAPAPISSGQGAALAAAARRIVAEDQPGPGAASRWALNGISACENPGVSSAAYAGQGAWKCNVFAGEAFYRAGLPFPLNGQDHYAGANNLPAQSRFFQPLARLDDVRPGDVLSISRKDDSGHVEIVTGVRRDANGQVVSISSAGAHEMGAAEGTTTAGPLLAAAPLDGRGATLSVGTETYRLLRPLAPPAGTVK